MENYVKREVDYQGNIRYYNSKSDLHRLDGPAIEWIDGDKEWWVIGNRHRLNGYAVSWRSVHKFWYLKNKNYSKSCHNRLYLFSILEPRRVELAPT
jgi:hypothetical protein